jgi:hypothetical protein
MSESPPRRTYSQEEVTEILKRALRQQSLRSEVLSHDELVEMATEVGIDREALESATADLAQTRAAELVRQTEARELAEERARLLGRFASSLFFYAVIGALLYFIDRRFSGGVWYYWVLVGWGIALLFRLRQVFFPEASLRRRREKEQRQARKRERRAEREARHRRLQEGLRTGGPTELINAGAREFETAVQAGVAALLTVAARKIQEHAARASDGVDRPGPHKRQR